MIRYIPCFRRLRRDSDQVPLPGQHVDGQRWSRHQFPSRYRPGDRRALAYKGEIEAPAFDFSQEDIDHFAAHLLFRWLNIERLGDIANFRGPSMSVGDVVEIDGRASSVDTAGFARIEKLRREQIVPGPADWLPPPEL
jgi:hypothetical protein